VKHPPFLCETFSGNLLLLVFLTSGVKGRVKQTAYTELYEPIQDRSKGRVRSQGQVVVELPRKMPQIHLCIDASICDNTKTGCTL
jgi:hypothetical protein